MMPSEALRAKIAELRSRSATHPRTRSILVFLEAIDHEHGENLSEEELDHQLTKLEDQIARVRGDLKQVLEAARMPIQA